LFLNFIGFYSVLPTVNDSKSIFSTLEVMKGNFPIPLNLRTLEISFLFSRNLKTAEAIITFASCGENFITNSYLTPDLMKPKNKI